MKSRLINICGPTATGKTEFALTLAEKYNCEIISADSRHVYIGMDIVTGKDIPPGFTKKTSTLVWRGRRLCYFSRGSIRIWLIDLVEPDEDFNVSYWRECALLVISDILSRQKQPLIVGGTGLYFKSLTQNLNSIDIPTDPLLRAQLSSLTLPQLLDRLIELNPARAASLNSSDRQNSRRLIRAIEISHFTPKPPIQISTPPNYEFLSLGLTAPMSFLIERVKKRLISRIEAGAYQEAHHLAQKYSYTLPSMSACGYAAFRKPDWESDWLTREKHYLKKQLTWFKKQPGIIWYDLSRPGWSKSAEIEVNSWFKV